MSAAACLASGVALAGVPVTQVIAVNPIDVCVANKAPLPPSCAPFNTVNQNGLPLSQNSTTNPIGFVYSYTNTSGATVYIDLTRAILNEIGVDVVWGKMVRYISPVINNPGDTAGQTYQTLNVVTSNCGFPGLPATGFQSCDLLSLSQQPCISNLPTTPKPSPPCPTSPLSTTPSTHNMFFVQTLNPPPSQAGSQIYDLSWVKANGVAIAANTFFPPAPLTPFIDVLAHGLMHNLCCDHTSFGAGPYNPITVDPNGGALQTTPSGVTVGECDSGYPACAANLLTIGNLRNESTANCLAVSNPPLPGETACAPGTPSLAGGTAAQMTTEAQQWSGLPLSQQGAPLDCSGFLVPIPSSTATVSWSPPSNSMTVNVTGAVNNSPCNVVSGTNYNLLASVLVAPSPLKFDSKNPHITSQSRSNLLQDIDWPVGDSDNNGPGSTYALGSLMSLCSTSTPQCLIVEFNLPGAGTTSEETDHITFSKTFTTSLTAGELCGAKVAFIFSHGYMTMGQLACANSTSNTAMANSQSPDLTAPAAPQIVNTTAFAAATASNPGCSLDNSGACSTNPASQGVYDGNPVEQPQLCYSGGVLVKC